MIKKILRVFLQILAIITTVYLVIGFLILPWVTGFLIPRQGTRILRTPVTLKAARLNPLDLVLSLEGLAILDSTRQTMIGFDSLRVDVSALDLFRKIYRIESFEIVGLEVNAALLSDGDINLRMLIPKTPVSTGDPDSKMGFRSTTGGSNESTVTVEPETPAVSAGLPMILVEQFRLNDSVIRFEDQTVQPVFTTILSDLVISMTGFSTQKDTLPRFSLSGQIDQSGKIQINAEFSPLSTPPGMDMTLRLSNYALDVLTPYIAKYTGRILDHGKLDVTLNYQVHDNQLFARHQLWIQRFRFGDKISSPDALNLPFGLAIALLEDPQGKIDILLPVEGNLQDPEFRFFHLLGQVARNFVLKIATKPFSVLGSLAGVAAESGSDEMGVIQFSPGQTELTGTDKTQLDQLVAALQARPLLNLTIQGSYDPVVDWKTIQAEIFARDYAQLREGSTRDDGELCELLYQRRFGLRALWDLVNKLKAAHENFDDTILSEEIKRQMIEEAPPNEVELRQLGQARAQHVYDYLLTAGFAADRLRIGASRPVKASMGIIPLELTLTISGDLEEISGDSPIQKTIVDAPAY